MKPINNVEVLLAGVPVGELIANRQGVYQAARKASPSRAVTQARIA